MRDEIAPSWHDIGKRLLKDKHIDKLDEIEKSHPNDMEGCCTEMFEYWLEVDGEANWNDLTGALKQIGQSALVEEVIQGIYVKCYIFLVIVIKIIMLTTHIGIFQKLVMYL